MPPTGPEQEKSNRKKRAALIAGISVLVLLLALGLALLLLRGGGGGGGGGAPSPGEGEAQTTESEDEEQEEEGSPTPPPEQAEAGEIPALLFFDEHETPGAAAEGGDGGTGMGGIGVGAGIGGGGGGRPLGTGDVSFRLYWRPPIHDVDLHVIDPNGHRLWFDVKTCPCGGILDRDDRTSGGPENIYWPTGQGPRGTYTYYAHYYEGFGDKEAILEVRKKGKVIKTHRNVLRGVGSITPRYTYTH
ncbi:MAG: hypothetical protein KAX44_03415 [Candidatus Brocadiae bacterium]|nr:hypothetical protein [Candidatus Brocadiia bacterium]